VRARVWSLRAAEVSCAEKDLKRTSVADTRGRQNRSEGRSRKENVEAPSFREAPTWWRCNAGKNTDASFVAFVV
jgi:hypothetical protein